MTNSKIALIGFIIALIPTTLVLIAGATKFFGVTFFNFFIENFSSATIFWKLIFFNMTFFAIPVTAIVFGLFGFRKSKNLGTFSIILGFLVLIWYWIQLIFD